MDARARVKAVAINLDGALGDTEPLWRDWLEDAGRRFRIDVAELDDQLPNWPQLLERFAEERAPVYLRPDADASAALRRLAADGMRIGVFTEAPEPLARVAIAQLGAARRVDVLETGAGALERLLRRLGGGAVVIRTRDQLVNLR